MLVASVIKGIVIPSDYVLVHRGHSNALLGGSGSHIECESNPLALVNNQVLVRVVRIEHLLDDWHQHLLLDGPVLGLLVLVLLVVFDVPLPQTVKDISHRVA